MKVSFLVTLRVTCCLVLTSIMTWYAAPPDAFATSPLLARSAPATMPFGYGLSVGAYDAIRAGQLGFNWIEVYGPPVERLATKVLYRVPLHASDWSQQSAFRARLIKLSYYHGAFIDAYEIGNEANLLSE